MERSRKPFTDMSVDEVRIWLHQTREHLQHKMQREQAYLDRRKTQGIRTPTDEAYERDLVLEADLLRFLDELEQSVLSSF